MAKYGVKTLETVHAADFKMGGGDDAGLGPFGKMIRVTEKDIVAAKQNEHALIFYVNKPVNAAFLLANGSKSFYVLADSWSDVCRIGRQDLIKDASVLGESFGTRGCSAFFSDTITSDKACSFYSEAFLSLDMGDAVDFDTSGLKFELLTPEIADMDGYISSIGS